MTSAKYVPSWCPKESREEQDEAVIELLQDLASKVLHGTY